MLKWFMNWWYAANRRTDLQILWPICKEHAKDIQEAREAFYVHAMMDDAWRCLDHEDMVRKIEELK